MLVLGGPFDASPVVPHVKGKDFRGIFDTQTLRSQDPPLPLPPLLKALVPPSKPRLWPSPVSLPLSRHSPCSRGSPAFAQAPPVRTRPPSSRSRAAAPLRQNWDLDQSSVAFQKNCMKEGWLEVHRPSRLFGKPFRRQWVVADWHGIYCHPTPTAEVCPVTPRGECSPTGRARRARTAKGGRGLGRGGCRRWSMALGGRYPRPWALAKRARTCGKLGHHWGAQRHVGRTAVEAAIGGGAIIAGSPSRRRSSFPHADEAGVSPTHCWSVAMSRTPSSHFKAPQPSTDPHSPSPPLSQSALSHRCTPSALVKPGVPVLDAGGWQPLRNRCVKHVGLDDAPNVREDWNIYTLKSVTLRAHWVWPNGGRAADPPHPAKQVWF